MGAATAAATRPVPASGTALPVPAALGQKYRPCAQAEANKKTMPSSLAAPQRRAPAIPAPALGAAASANEAPAAVSVSSTISTGSAAEAEDDEVEADTFVECALPLKFIQEEMVFIRADAEEGRPDLPPTCLPAYLPSYLFQIAVRSA